MSALNKGLGQLAIEVDLAIATDPPPGGPSAPTSRAEIPPVPPILDLAPLNLDATLHVHAVKAQTRVAADLDKMAQIPSLPEIHPEQQVSSIMAPRPASSSLPAESARPISRCSMSSPLRTPNPATGRTSPSRPPP